MRVSERRERIRFIVVFLDDNRMPCVRAKREFEKHGWDVNFIQIENMHHTYAARSTPVVWEFYKQHSL